MKKSLLAVAAIGAFASAAQAQSSVTVYGILDVGYVGANSSVTSANVPTQNYATNSTTYTNGAVKTTQSQFGQSAEQTSRMGFKGTEDLGNGKSAFFTVEFGLTPNSAGASTTTAANGTALNNRQSFVGLKQNGLGDVAIGTQYQPVHISVGKTDPGMQNNMTGSVIYTGQADSGVTGAVGGNTAAYQSRSSNGLTLNSEVMAGIQLHAMAILNNTNATTLNNTAAGQTGNVATGGNTNTNGWALGADYTFKKFFITGAYTAVKNLTTTTNQLAYPNAAAATAGTTNNGGFAIWSGAQTALNVQDNTGYVGATYDFGILKAYASWISRKASDTANSAYYQKRQAEQIGVRSFVTPTVEAWASAGVGTFTPYGLNQNSAHFNAWQLGSNYWLSKRTNLYAIYGQYAQANATYVSTTTAGASTTGNSSNNANSYAVGIRHTF